MRKLAAALVLLVVVALAAGIAAWQFNEQAKERMLRQVAEFRDQIDTFERFYAVVNRPFRNFRF